ncbi:hypothetical protein [Peribacillus simplex]|uniref:Uncharacterized protein n=1 Tax=Peribacillus simplex TaxID=1478 RepID=A0A9W4PCW2_9BACI|nr:hypothetical protein [Peribacillus simplex]CAH0169277.1 hypothetical protein SRABI133_01143 [Peribacillus simplex]
MEDEIMDARIKWRYLIEKDMNILSSIKKWILLFFVILLISQLLIPYFIKDFNLPQFIFILMLLVLGISQYIFHKNFLLLKVLLPILFLFLCIFIILQIDLLLSAGVIIAILTNFLLAIIIHYVPFYIITRNSEMDQLKFKEFFSHFNIKLFCAFFVSPDYSLSSVYKKVLNKREKCEHSFPKDKDEYCIQCLENSRYRLKYFIVMSNWINLIAVILLMIFFLFNEINRFNHSFIVFFMTFITFHIISRVLEISYAFYNDVVKVKSKYFKNNGPEKINENRFFNYWRGSALRRPERISLAIHSYGEIIFLFTILYFLINVFFGKNSCEYTNLQGFFDMCTATGVDSLTNSTEFEFTAYPNLFQYLLYSASVTFFNFSFPTGGVPFAWHIAHVVQVFMSIILIVLSFALYISWTDKMTKDEIQEFMLLKQHEELEEKKYEKRVVSERIERKTKIKEDLVNEENNLIEIEKKIEEVKNKYKE